MMRMKLAATAAFAATVLTVQGGETAEWQELFNGKDLTGWSGLTGKGPDTATLSSVPGRPPVVALLCDHRCAQTERCVPLSVARSAE